MVKVQLSVMKDVRYLEVATECHCITQNSRDARIVSPEEVQGLQ